MFYRLWNRRKRKAEPELDLPPVGSRDRQFRGLLAGVPLIIGLVTVSVLGLMVFMHMRFVSQLGECRSNPILSANLQMIAEEEPYFLQLNGRLKTELYSPESPEHVTQLLNRAQAAFMREAVVSGDFRNVPTMTWEIEAAEGGGSHIVLHCP